MRQRLSLTLCCLFISIWLTPAAAQQVLTFRQPATGPTADYITAVLEEAYADLGIELNYQPIPRLRAEQLAQNGEIAGELGRLGGLEEELDNLNRVPFKLYEFSIVLVARKAACGLCTLKSVNNIAYIGGMRAAETVLTDANFDKTTFRQSDIHQVSKLLNAERIDAALIADFQLRNLELSQPKDFIVYHVKSEVGFHYLHQKYKHLIEPLYQRLSLMQASGRLSQLRQQFKLQAPEQLKPMPMPTELTAAAAARPGLTGANGNGRLWQLINTVYGDTVAGVKTLASNWPRALNALLEDKAHMVVGVYKNQFDNELLYSKKRIAMDDALYLFASDRTKKQAILAGQESHTVCYSGNEELHKLLPDSLSFYRANTSLDCFALLDLNRIEGVIDYKYNLPDWVTTPYHRSRLREPLPLYVAFKNNELGAQLKAHLDRALEAKLSPRFISENSNTIR